MQQPELQKTVKALLEKYNNNRVLLAGHLKVSKNTINNWIAGRCMPFLSTQSDIKELAEKWEIKIKE